jgi:hypothetical protein
MQAFIAYVRPVCVMYETDIRFLVIVYLTTLSEALTVQLQMI